MKNITLNHGEDIDVPICWDETTTRAFQRIKAKGEMTMLQAFCLLNNLDYDETAQESNELIEAALYQCSSFVFNEPEAFRFRDPEPFIELRGKKIEVPKKLESLTLEQNMHLRVALSKDGVVLEELISTALAVYLQPLLDGGRFNYTKAMELKAEIEELPIAQTFPIGFFYLSKLNNYGASGLLYSLRWKLKNLKLKLRLRMKRMLPTWRFSLILILLTSMQLGLACLHDW